MIQAPGSWFDLIEMSFRSVKNLAKCLCYSSEFCPNFPFPRRTWSTTPRWTTTEPGWQRAPPTGPSRFSKSRRVLRPGLLISEVTRDPSGRWGAQQGCGGSYIGWKRTLLTSVFLCGHLYLLPHDTMLTALIQALRMLDGLVSSHTWS